MLTEAPVVLEMKKLNGHTSTNGLIHRQTKANGQVQINGHSYTNGHSHTNGHGDSQQLIRANVAMDNFKRKGRGMVQHKAEARAFYRVLSIAYDSFFNLPFWTQEMRPGALEPAKLDSPDLKVIDVGGGTGFCTCGVVDTVKPENVTLVDQSVHQLAVARKKPELKGVTILEGDAEDLKFPTDTFDRYISAGSIEYWPEPQRGIKEAYRVLKEGGMACTIGPVHPTYPLSRFMADAWMLFPTEEEYTEWYERAGFVDIKIKRIGPSWYRGVRRHGLIIGCSVTGVKPKAGESPLEMGPIQEEIHAPQNGFLVAMRFALGFLAASYYFFIPVYMYLKHLVWPRNLPGF